MQRDRSGNARHKQWAKTSLQRSCGVHEGTWYVKYPGGGTNLWVKFFCFMIFDRLYEDREANGYPSRSHGYMPTETESADG